MVRPVQDDCAHPGRSGRGYGDKLQIAKMNVDENREVPAKFGIRGIPTLMLFRTANWPPPRSGAVQGPIDGLHLDANL